MVLWRSPAHPLPHETPAADRHRVKPIYNKQAIHGRESESESERDDGKGRREERTNTVLHFYCCGSRITHLGFIKCISFSSSNANARERNRETLYSLKSQRKKKTCIHLG